LRAAHTGAHFFAGRAPAGAIPADGVIVGYLASYAHGENFLQSLFWN
jgi:hypothetical protein